MGKRGVAQKSRVFVTFIPKLKTRRMNFNFIAILAAVAGLIIGFGISKKRSFLGFLLWYGISFIIIWIIFEIFKLLSI